MTTCVIMGDIGKKTRYHVGDEAMTEAAIDQLAARGIDGITLIATDPATAQAWYGRPALARFGFSFRWPRHRLEAALSQITAALDADTPLHRAVAAADAVLIAGGGNMASPYAYQLYERVALTRLARHCGTPLHVTSQTIGPCLTGRDRELLAEILADAVSFGAREADSARLARDLGGRPGQVVHTLDDAVLLAPRDADRRAVASLGLPGRYIIAGLADTPGTSGLSTAEYAALAAGTLDEAAARLDAQVVIAPNMGSFDGPPVADQLFGATVAAAGAAGRLRLLPMLPARQHAELARHAVLTVTTRYHPAVFAAAAGTPVVAAGLSHYSSVRLRGCLGNAGLAGYVLPASSWGGIADAAAEAAGRADLTAHMRAVHAHGLATQKAWWDSLAEAVRTGRWHAPDPLPAAEQLEPTGSWRKDAARLFPVFDALGAARTGLDLAGKERDELRTLLADSERRATRLAAENTLLRRQKDALTRALAAARGRRAARLADAAARLIRPAKRGGGTGNGG